MVTIIGLSGEMQTSYISQHGDNLMEFLLFLLAGIGITSIIVDSEIFAGWKESFGKRIQRREEKLGELAKKDRNVWLMRKWYYLINCYQCSGFWVGFMLGALVHPVSSFNGWWRVLEAIMCGGVISYAAPLGMALYNYFNVTYTPPEAKCKS